MDGMAALNPLPVSLITPVIGVSQLSPGIRLPCGGVTTSKLSAKPFLITRCTVFKPIERKFQFCFAIANSWIGARTEEVSGFYPQFHDGSRLSGCIGGQSQELVESIG